MRFPRSQAKLWAQRRCDVSSRLRGKLFHGNLSRFPRWRCRRGNQNRSPPKSAGVDWRDQSGPKWSRRSFWRSFKRQQLQCPTPGLCPQFHCKQSFAGRGARDTFYGQQCLQPHPVHSVPLKWALKFVLHGPGGLADLRALSTAYDSNDSKLGGYGLRISARHFAQQT